LRTRGGDTLDPAVLQQDRAPLVGVGRGVHDPRVGDDDRGAHADTCEGSASRASRTAIRTATPISTWWVMTERGPSAMAGSISTPRFIGPGCITMASGLATASLSASRP